MPSIDDRDAARTPLRPELAAPLGVCPSSQRARRAGGRPGRWTGSAIRTRGPSPSCSPRWPVAEGIKEVAHAAALWSAARDRLDEASAEKLSLDERASGAAYERIRDEILDTERQLRTARAQLRAADDQAAREHNKLVRAQSDLDHGRGALADAPNGADGPGGRVRPLRPRRPASAQLTGVPLQPPGGRRSLRRGFTQRPCRTDAP